MANKNHNMPQLFSEAVALRQDAFVKRGLALQAKGHYEEALKNYDEAITLNPNHAEIYDYRGCILQKLGMYDKAAEAFGKVTLLRPDNAIGYHHLGSALYCLMRYDEALASYNKATALNPNYAGAYNDKGAALWKMGRLAEAQVSFDKAAALTQDIPYLFGTRLHTKMHLCDWQEIDADFNLLSKALEENRPVSKPFQLLATPLSAALQKKCATNFAKDKYPPSRHPLYQNQKYSHERIRIGYFSSDFRNHATSFLMAGLFELHDRTKFEVTAFSFGPNVNDDMRQRLEKVFEHFIDVSGKSEQEIATLARSMEIDIAVDLNGFTNNTRTGIFAMRPAPIQASYMGYPGTMGTDYIDYLIADSIVIPEEHKRYYAEKIVYLPDSYQVNDSARKISNKNLSRKDAGLPEAGFVFCCFNNNYKITPDIFDIWMRLLGKVEGSVLWLLEGNQSVVKNLQAEAKARGIGEHRLIFAKRVTMDEHLPRHQLADLFLDTFYCNAHTTASDALWEGLPVLTCLGETFAGRVAASLLSAANLPELITRSHAEYEALALELATNPQKLATIRQKLAQTRATCPLFNTALFTKHIEDAYVQMWKKSQAGKSADDIYVSA
jgi:predicted O-linked N-acetylglucosamine transferase (SPINDLY family)